MNQKEKYFSLKEAKGLLDWRMIQNSKINMIRIGANEGLNHAQKKTEVCWELLRRGKKFYTEAVFKNKGGRADIYVLDDSCAIEILDSEDQESIADKMKRYPCQVYFLTVRQTVNDIMGVME